MSTGMRMPDTSDVAALYTQYAPQLRRYLARRIPDADLVDDVLSETFLHVMRELSHYEDRISVSPA